jgi:hypothetical protein
MKRWLAAASLLGLAPTSLGATVRHAVVVGANDGGGVLEPLRYAERDAESVASLLVELGSFDEELVTVLYAPTAADLRRALAEHAAIAESYDDDLFLFYYSGHADAQGIRLASQRYWFASLKHDLRVIDSDVRLGILDACRSGAITRLKGAAVAESMFGADQIAAEGEAWLTASSADEAAAESDHLRGGFFTHYLLSGMRGAADTDDGIVDLDELYRYTFDRVVARTGETTSGVQHPHFEYALSGAGSIPMTQVGLARAKVLLPAEVSGHIAVLRLPDQTQLAEMTKVAGQPAALAVPPGRYRVRRRFEDKLYGVTLGAEVEILQWGNPTDPSPAQGRGARTDHYLGMSEHYERKLNLGSSPAVAAITSAVVPGAGQLYNGQVWKGAAYFGATSTMLAGTLVNPSDLQVSRAFWPVLGATIWGASIADALYNVHRREEKRPILGGQISLGGSFGGDPFGHHFGLSGDVMLRPGLSLGLDRLGWSGGYPEGGYDLHVGSRLMVAAEWQKFRPGLLLAFGLRHGRLEPESVLLTRFVFGAGANLRYYVVPRYFMELGMRWERDGEWDALVSSVSMGLHVGR